MITVIHQCCTHIVCAVKLNNTTGQFNSGSASVCITSDLMEYEGPPLLAAASSSGSVHATIINI